MAQEKGPEENEGEVSFGDILSRFEREQSRGGGRRVGKAEAVRRGTVVGVSGDYVLVDFGAKSEGVIPAEELRDPQGNLAVRPGDSFEVLITGRNAEGLVTLSRLTGPRPRDWEELRAAYERHEVIPGRVSGLVKGGLTVDVGARAFLPASRSGARDPAEMEKLVGEEIRCRITRLDPEDEDLVVDRRVVLEEEARLAREQMLAGLEEGQVVRGVVRSITDYGAFIDLGGVDGLLHVADMSWSRTASPRAQFQVGDTLDLKVLAVDREAGKISLGLKQMYPDPWEQARRELKEGDRVRGTVTRLTDFGAFVEIRPGVEGLIHISEMSWTKRVRKPSDLLQRGEEVEAAVLKIDPDAKRIALGLKQVLGNPWDSIQERYPAGKVVQGKVVRLAKFGAFVEVEEGIDGLLHISDLSADRRLDHPSEVVKIGQLVKAVVLEADREKRRLKLGMKQLEATSLEEYLREHKPGDRVVGRVVRVEGSQATIQLGEGVEGVCPLAGLEPPVGTDLAARLGPEPAEKPAREPARGTLAEALAAAWKGPLPATPEPGPASEPLREGQLRSFLITRLDPAARRIELAVS